MKTIKSQLNLFLVLLTMFNLAGCLPDSVSKWKEDANVKEEEPVAPGPTQKIPTGFQYSSDLLIFTTGSYRSESNRFCPMPSMQPAGVRFNFKAVLQGDQHKVGDLETKHHLTFDEATGCFEILDGQEVVNNTSSDFQFAVEATIAGLQDPTPAVAAVKIRVVEELTAAMVQKMQPKFKFDNNLIQGPFIMAVGGKKSEEGGNPLPYVIEPVESLGPNFYWSVNLSSVPQGLAFDPLTGRIAGIPTQEIANATIQIFAQHKNDPAKKTKTTTLTFSTVYRPQKVAQYSERGFIELSSFNSILASDIQPGGYVNLRYTHPITGQDACTIARVNNVLKKDNQISTLLLAREYNNHVIPSSGVRVTAYSTVAPEMNLPGDIYPMDENDIALDNVCRIQSSPYGDYPAQNQWMIFRNPSMSFIPSTSGKTAFVFNSNEPFEIKTITYPISGIKKEFALANAEAGTQVINPVLDPETGHFTGKLGASFEPEEFQINAKNAVGEAISEVFYIHPVQRPPEKLSYTDQVFLLVNDANKFEVGGYITADKTNQGIGGVGRVIDVVNDDKHATYGVVVQIEEGAFVKGDELDNHYPFNVNRTSINQYIVTSVVDGQQIENYIAQNANNRIYVRNGTDGEGIVRSYLNKKLYIKKIAGEFIAGDTLKFTAENSLNSMVGSERVLNVQDDTMVQGHTAKLEISKLNGDANYYKVGDDIAGSAVVTYVKIPTVNDTSYEIFVRQYGDNITLDTAVLPNQKIEKIRALHYLTNIDGNPDAVKSVRPGLQFATVENDKTGNTNGRIVAKDAINGKFYFNVPNGALHPGQTFDVLNPVRQGLAAYAVIGDQLSTTQLIQLRTGVEYSLDRQLDANVHATYTVTPALPDGLTLDPKTGSIKGTPTKPSALTAYSVTAKNDFNPNGISAKFLLEVSNFFEVRINDDLPNYIIHRLGKNNQSTACRIYASDLASGERDQKIVSCYLEAPELNLMQHGIKFLAESGPGMCDHIAIRPASRLAAPYFGKSNPSFNVYYKFDLAAECPNYDGPISGRPLTAAEQDKPQLACPSNIMADRPCDEGKITVVTYKTVKSEAGNQCVSYAEFEDVSCAGTYAKCVDGYNADINTESIKPGKASETIKNSEGHGARTVVTYTVDPAEVVNDGDPTVNWANYVTNHNMFKVAANREEEYTFDMRSFEETFLSNISGSSDPMGGRHPAYTFTCYDGSKTVLAQIHVLVRDWDTSFDYKSPLDKSNAPIAVNAPIINKGAEEFVSPEAIAQGIQPGSILQMGPERHFYTVLSIDVTNTIRFTPAAIAEYQANEVFVKSIDPNVNIAFNGDYIGVMDAGNMEDPSAYNKLANDYPDQDDFVYPDLKGHLEFINKEKLTAEDFLGAQAAVEVVHCDLLEGKFSDPLKVSGVRVKSNATPSQAGDYVTVDGVQVKDENGVSIKMRTTDVIPCIDDAKYYCYKLQPTQRLYTAVRKGTQVTMNFNKNKAVINDGSDVIAKSINSREYCFKSKDYYFTFRELGNDEFEVSPIRRPFKPINAENF